MNSQKYFVIQSKINFKVEANICWNISDEWLRRMLETFTEAHLAYFYKHYSPFLIKGRTFAAYFQIIGDSWNLCGKEWPTLKTMFYRA